MTLVRIVLALGAALAAVAWMFSWRRGERPGVLGAVSDRWVAEHQLGAGQDSNR